MPCVVMSDMQFLDLRLGQVHGELVNTASLVIAWVGWKSPLRHAEQAGALNAPYTAEVVSGGKEGYLQH